MGMGFRHIYRTSRYLKSCRSLADVEALLKVTHDELSTLAYWPVYHEFNVLKRNGGFRPIEAPEKNLKQIQRKLNAALQCLYFFEKPDASYGFVLSHKGNKHPRNILTHASCHVGASYMVNVDFEDFFHQIKKDQVYEIFRNPPLRLSRDGAFLLANLCTNKGRLPMGAPTSPVLSNLAAMKLDVELREWTEKSGILYTRFVDDLTFSSSKEIKPSFLWNLKERLKAFQLKLNDSKTKWFGPLDTKVVTGLEVSDQVRVPGSFFYELSEDLKRLKYAVEAHYQVLGFQESELLDTFKQQVSGKIGFVQMVYGVEDKRFIKYLEAYEKAINPIMEKLSIRWTDFPYKSI